MKRVLLIAAALCLLTGLALPLHALEVDFKGEFYVEGLFNSNEGMLVQDDASAFYQMRLRLQTDFKVTDSLELTTRFDALERVMGTRYLPTENDTNEENISFDYAYLTYKSPIGMFQAGRMLGGAWGTPFADDEIDADRLKYVVPLTLGGKKIYLFAILEKVTELDKGTAEDNIDNDKYYIGGVYRSQEFTTGLLTAYYDYKRFFDPGQAFAIDAFNTAYATSLANNPGNTVGTYMGAYAMGLPGTYNPNLGLPAAMGGQKSDPFNILFTRGATTSGEVFLLSPYFTGKFGNLGINAELDYIFGTLSYDRSPFSGIKNPDRDVKGFAYFVEGTYDMGPFTFQAGFAHSSGDADYENTLAADYGKDDLTAMGYVAPGVEWAKMFIFGSDTHGMNTTLGNGVGNHVGDGMATASVAMIDGYQMLYGGADYALSDTMTVGLLAALSKADDIPNNEPGETYEDDQGVEVDLTFSWKITENLEYTAIGAYLFGGDYWKYRASGSLNPNIETDVYALYHQIKLTF